MFVICDHAEGCTRESCSYTMAHPGDTFDGRCGTVNGFVKIIRYCPLKDSDPNVIFKRQKDGD